VCLVVSAAPPLDLLAPVMGNVLVAMPLFLALIVLLVSLPQEVDVFLHGIRSSSYQLLGTAGRTVMKRNGQTEMTHAAAGMEAILLWAWGAHADQAASSPACIRMEGSPSAMP